MDNAHQNGDVDSNLHKFNNKKIERHNSQDSDKPNTDLVINNVDKSDTERKENNGEETVSMDGKGNKNVFHEDSKQDSSQVGNEDKNEDSQEQQMENSGNDSTQSSKESVDKNNLELEEKDKTQSDDMDKSASTNVDKMKTPTDEPKEQTDSVGEQTRNQETNGDSSSDKEKRMDTSEPNVSNEGSKTNEHIDIESKTNEHSDEEKTTNKHGDEDNKTNKHGEDDNTTNEHGDEDNKTNKHGEDDNKTNEHGNEESKTNEHVYEESKTNELDDEIKTNEHSNEESKPNENSNGQPEITEHSNTDNNKDDYTDEHNKINEHNEKHKTNENVDEAHKSNEHSNEESQIIEHSDEDNNKNDEDNLINEHSAEDNKTNDHIDEHRQTNKDVQNDGDEHNVNSKKETQNNGLKHDNEHDNQNKIQHDYDSPTPVGPDTLDNSVDDTSSNKDSNNVQTHLHSTEDLKTASNDDTASKHVDDDGLQSAALKEHVASSNNEIDAQQDMPPVLHGDNSTEQPCQSNIAVVKPLPQENISDSNGQDNKTIDKESAHPNEDDAHNTTKQDGQQSETNENNDTLEQDTESIIQKDSQDIPTDDSHDSSTKEIPKEYDSPEHDNQGNSSVESKHNTTPSKDLHQTTQHSTSLEDVIDVEKNPLTIVNDQAVPVGQPPISTTYQSKEEKPEDKETNDQESTENEEDPSKNTKKDTNEPTEDKSNCVSPENKDQNEEWESNDNQKHGKTEEPDEIEVIHSPYIWEDDESSPYDTPGGDTPKQANDADKEQTKKENEDKKQYYLEQKEAEEKEKNEKKKAEDEEREKAEAEEQRQAKIEKAEADEKVKAKKEKSEQEKVEADEREKHEKEKAETEQKEKLVKQKAEADERDKLEKEKAAKEEREKLLKEKAEAEEKERAEAEEKERAEAEEREKLEKEKAEAEQKMRESEEISCQTENLQEEQKEEAPIVHKKEEDVKEDFTKQMFEDSSERGEDRLPTPTRAPTPEPPKSPEPREQPENILHILPGDLDARGKDDSDDHKRDHVLKRGETSTPEKEEDMRSNANNKVKHHKNAEAKEKKIVEKENNLEVKEPKQEVRGVPEEKAKQSQPNRSPTRKSSLRKSTTPRTSVEKTPRRTPASSQPKKETHQTAVGSGTREYKRPVTQPNPGRRERTEPPKPHRSDKSPDSISTERSHQSSSMSKSRLLQRDTVRSTPNTTKRPRTTGVRESNEGRSQQREFFKHELTRIEENLKKETSKIHKPTQKKHTPYIFNNLAPYYDTHTVRYLIETPEELQHTHTSRCMAIGLTDPWKALEMEQCVLPVIRSKPINRQEKQLKKEKKIDERAKKGKKEGSTRLPKYPMVTMETTDLANKKLYYSDVPMLREELKQKYSANATKKVGEDYEKTKQDFFRMDLDKLDEVHPVNREHMKSTYYAYLQNTPGSKKAVNECMKSIEKANKAK